MLSIGLLLRSRIWDEIAANGIMLCLPDPPINKSGVSPQSVGENARNGLKVRSIGVDGTILAEQEFQTSTMARLLESQGHSKEAEQLRDALLQRDNSKNQEALEVLERWIAIVQQNYGVRSG